MCFSARVSAATYVIGTIGTVALWKRGFKPEAVFYAVVIQMQLIELVLWTTQPECGRVNRMATVAGILVNHLEPIALWLAIIYFSRHLPSWLHGVLIVFILLTIWYTIGAIRSDGTACTRVTTTSCPHLHWAWNRQAAYPYYYIFFVLCLVLLSVYGLQPNGGKHALLLLISYMVSFVIYEDTHSTGAMWCFAAAFMPLVLLFLYEPISVDPSCQKTM
jgi:hypothetical protein